MLPRSIRRCRVPKRQQTVKIEPLHLANHGPVVKPVRQRGQPGGIEQRHDGGVQERQVAETALQLVIAHRQLGIDALFLGEPGQRRLLVAELVDQLQPDRLMAGEDAAVGHGLQFAVAQMPAILHQAFEPSVGILDDRIQRRLGFRAGRLETVRRRLERARFHRLDLDADLVEQIGKVRILEQHADRADQRGLLRHDVVAGERRDIGAGGGETVDDDDKRFLVAQPRQRVVKLLGAGGGAAGAVDMDDDGARQRRAGEPVERLHPVTVAADQALDGDAGDVGPHAGEAGAIAANRRHAGDGEHDHADGDDAPERELPAHPAAVDDQVGIKRHGRAPCWSFRIAAKRRVRNPYSRTVVMGSGLLASLGPGMTGHSSPSPFSLSSPLRLSAVPRMSPSVAPESEEPYCAIASFSSATSSALIETCTLWVRRSNWMTRASTFWPAAKRSGRCSERSRASSERLMKAEYSVPTIFTSMPPSFTSVTSQVTTAPFLSSPAAPVSAAAAAPPPESCLMPSEMRSFSTSTSRTCALTLSPFLYSSMTCSPGRFQSRSDRCTMPSTSPSRPRNRPNSVLFLTSPSTSEPGGYFSRNTSQGLRMVCLRPSEMRRLTGSTSRTCTSTSWEVETILPGCTFFLVHDISETWIRPSMPGSSSTKAP